MGLQHFVFLLRFLAIGLFVTWSFASRLNQTYLLRGPSMFLRFSRFCAQTFSSASLGGFQDAFWNPLVSANFLGGPVRAQKGQQGNIHASFLRYLLLCASSNPPAIKNATQKIFKSSARGPHVVPKKQSKGLKLGPPNLFKRYCCFVSTWAGGVMRSV